MRWTQVVTGVATFGLLALGAFLALRPTTVRAIHPTVGKVVQTVVASGQIMPPAEIKMGALVSSTALEVPVKEGQLVRKGELLISLDDTEAQATLAEAQANLDAAKAGRSERIRMSAPAARARLLEAEANLSQAQSTYNREKKLFEASVTTSAALEETQTAVKLAQAQKQAADLQVKAASQGGTQSLQAEASVALGQAQVAIAQEQLNRHTIRSPTDGVVLARSVEPGDAVLSGAALFVISATGRTRIRIEPDERNLGLLKEGQPAVASTEAFPDRQFSATVKYIAPAVDPQRGTVEVRLEVENPPDYLRPHMTASVEIEVASLDQGLLVPRAAIRQEMLDPHVLLLKNGRVEKRAVGLGVRGDVVVQVKQGLEKSDTVVFDEEHTPTIGARATPSFHSVSAN